MPLSPNGLCEAEITAPASVAANATAGVGATPRSSIETPSLAKPAHNAACNIGPEIRVSRPTAIVDAPSTRAAARPSASTSSGVRSTLATPRTPSVPNRSVTRRLRLPLGVLRRLAGLLEAVLLRLLLARVAREEAGLLDLRARLRVELGERTGDAEAQGAGLTRDAAAGARRGDVVDL